MSSLRNDYALLIGHIQSRYRGQIVLTAADQLDETLFRPLGSRLNLPVIGLTTPLQQAVDILGNADAYIGGRWHPSIFALRGGAPIVVLSARTFKMQALSRMAGLSPDAFDVWSLAGKKEAIATQLMEHLEAGHGLRERLCRWAALRAEESWGNVAYLRNWTEA